ncbi:MAG: c-type cytochrome biogenesis protein CcsB [Proteobacteria bacterium]|nr:c-type cytochrome biogenesis protein CcsB [Pseudomonadota bacterium]MBU4469146.1 c-type cytochrome biogenesis protein CcsB [Pseudomonadota bacterium]MCG2752178.1 c-type cytochrome biogenesis protein CcsB [Desulfobacteraceae bacterium]
MDIVIIIFYLLGTVGYMAYLFFQKDSFQRIGFGVLLAGFVVHCIQIVASIYKLGYVPVENLNQTLSISAWAIIGVFFWIQYQYHLKILGIFAAPLAAFIMVAASGLPMEPSQTQTVLKSLWLQTHILFVFLGEAAFALACGTGLLYLLQERAIKSKSRGFFYKRLPSLDLLDLTGHACIMAGFLLVTVGLITGFVYAKSLWGRFWNWDPKEVWSCITWLIYAALIHQRYTVGWRGRKSAILAIIGFVAVVFTFLGVNFILKGHHEPFTRW